MTQSTLHERLDTLGLRGFKSSLIRQYDDPNYDQLPFNDRLLQLLDAEINERENRKIKRLMQNSAIKDKQASLENIEYSSKRGVERSHILSLATCDYIDKGQNISKNIIV